MSETNAITSLKEALCIQQQLLQKLYNELDVEREASATAASEALSMILRLQGEKAAVKMEAEQYKRLAEEKMFHAEESLAIFEDLIYQKEMEAAALDYQVQAYRYKLLSMGCIDLGVGELKFPENLLQRNEILFGDTSVQSIRRRNSAPPVPFRFSNFKKGTAERERSASPETDMIAKIVEEQMAEEINYQNLDLEKDKSNDMAAVGDISSYWEQIRRLEERVKEIAGEHYANLRCRSSSSSLFSQASTSMSCDPAKVVIANELDQVKHPENLLDNETTVDSTCSLSVHDVFEVPQTDENLESCGRQTKEEGKLVLQGDERLGKLDSVPHEAVNSYFKHGTDSVKKMLLSTECETSICRPRDGVSVDCHLAIVRPKIGVAEPQPEFQQLTRTSEISEIEGQALRQELANRREEELKLLNEIREQLNSIQSQIRSWETKKFSPEDDLPMLLLSEAMLHFWL